MTSTQCGIKTWWSGCLFWCFVSMWIGAFDFNKTEGLFAWWAAPSGEAPRKRYFSLTKEPEGVTIRSEWPCAFWNSTYSFRARASLPTPHSVAMELNCFCWSIQISKLSGGVSGLHCKTVPNSEEVVLYHCTEKHIGEFLWPLVSRSICLLFPAETARLSLNAAVVFFKFSREGWLTAEIYISESR